MNEKKNEQKKECHYSKATDTSTTVTSSKMYEAEIFDEFFFLANLVLIYGLSFHPFSVPGAYPRRWGANPS